MSDEKVKYGRLTVLGFAVAMVASWIVDDCTENHHLAAATLGILFAGWVTGVRLYRKRSGGGEAK